MFLGSRSRASVFVLVAEEFLTVDSHTDDDGDDDGGGGYVIVVDGKLFLFGLRFCLRLFRLVR